MKSIFICIFIASTFISIQSEAQGCVAIRSNGGACMISHGEVTNNKSWQLNVNGRYFHSYRHFVGTTEQKERVHQKTDVRNWQTSLDISVVKHLSSRWSLSLNLPISSNQRSSKYEHLGNASTSPLARNTTQSFGIGDTRVAAYGWLLNPHKMPKGNVQIGFGLKLPTGNYRVNDYFRKTDTSFVLGPVDQSIQLGDGGTGITLELNGYRSLARNISAYANAYYLLNPMEQNGVSTSRGGIDNPTSVKYFTNTMSVPDQYMLRGGVSLQVKQFTFSGGARIEGLPSEDLIGGSKGFRRPGYVVAAEPNVVYKGKTTQWYLTVPIALQRNRTQSYSDKLRSTPATKVQGDAAFSNYSVNMGVSFSF